MSYSLGDALDILNAKDKNGDPIPFSMEFYTWNELKKTGGELVKIDKARLVCKKGYSGSNSKKIVRKREPNNYGNFTRTIEILDKKYVIEHGHNLISVHILLLEQINNKQVHWYING